MKRSEIEHVVVYRSEAHFCGWPFNGGLWQFLDGELAVGFVRGACDYSSAVEVGHRTVDNERGEHLVIRSSDGGGTWPQDSITTVYRRPEYDKRAMAAPYSLTGLKSVDPAADGFCLICGYGIPPEEDRTTMFVTTSTDRGRSWTDPVRMRAYGFADLGGRPSYVVRRDGMLLLFGHGSRTAGERRSVPLVLGSRDGGHSWGLVGEVELAPELPMGIMPYPLILPDGRILMAVRRQYDFESAYTQVYVSDDGGRTWAFLSRVNDWGAPANLVLLPDGRLVCVYGYRRPPFGIRAAVSIDQGKSWSEEIVLRDDGGSGDLGYPRSVVRPDGVVVSIYYFNLAEDILMQNGGVRHIAATIWRP